MLLLINKKMTQKFYITTPIYYVNDIPHIGHAYCTLATDTIARYWRTKLGAENVHFLTGTDENSQKTVDAAQKNNQEVYAYLDDMAKNWRETWEKIGISFDDFIRTTEERHKNTVNEIFQTIFDNGDIYKGIYKGKYCTGCETFLKDADLDENGHCPAHKKAPQELEEENYFFRLSKYEDILLELFEKNPDFLLPQSRQNEILSFIKSGLEDISVSRETAEFGISLPMDNKHKVYVWFDALLNYISAIKNTNKTDFWDNVHHIIGKDITKFHCVIWPAMLIAAGIKPPQTVYAHGFFTINGTKMSKSLGNVVSPLDLSDKYGNDALRIGLLNSFEFGNDGDFSLDNFTNFYNTKLAGGIGNLFNRVVVLTNKFLDGEKPQAEISEESKTRLTKFSRAFENKKIKEAIGYFFEEMDTANLLLNKTEVWRIAKTDLEKSKPIFGKLIKHLEVIAKMAEVLTPETYPKMLTMLGNKKIGEKNILFTRVET